jgi:hypothetical protein
MWVLFAAAGIQMACGDLPVGLREALAEFETGATTRGQCPADRLVGKQNEISRYQILPSVWRQFSGARNYHDPEIAWSVAARILQERERWFRDGTGRPWDYFDIYVMWNAPGQYRRAGWERARLSRVITERAERFANLMEVRARTYADSR